MMSMVLDKAEDYTSYQELLALQVIKREKI